MKSSLIEQYRQVHADAALAFPGRSLLPYAYIVNTLIRKWGSLTVLDYGCGQGLQYTVDRLDRWWGVMPVLYDPAVDAYAARPNGKFSGVICTDVLEHIPEDELEALLDDVFGYAVTWVFLTVCCREAKRILPNGMNAHCTVKPQEWWLELIDRKHQEHKGVATVRVEFTP